jgi:hypothetical protein
MQLTAPTAARALLRGPIKSHGSIREKVRARRRGKEEEIHGTKSTRQARLSYSAYSRLPSRECLPRYAGRASARPRPRVRRWCQRGLRKPRTVISQIISRKAHAIPLKITRLRGWGGGKRLAGGAARAAAPFLAHVRARASSRHTRGFRCTRLLAKDTRESHTSPALARVASRLLSLAEARGRRDARHVVAMTSSSSPSPLPPPGKYQAPDRVFTHKRLIVDRVKCWGGVGGINHVRRKRRRIRGSFGFEINSKVDWSRWNY